MARKSKVIALKIFSNQCGVRISENEICYATFYKYKRDWDGNKIDVCDLWKIGEDGKINGQVITRCDVNRVKKIKKNENEN